MSRTSEKRSTIQAKKSSYNIWNWTRTELRDMTTAVADLDLSTRESEYLREARSAHVEVVVNCVLLHLGQQMWKRCEGSRNSQEQARLRTEFMRELIDDVEENYLLISEKMEREKLSDTP